MTGSNCDNWPAKSDIIPFILESQSCEIRFAFLVLLVMVGVLDNEVDSSLALPFEEDSGVDAAIAFFRSTSLTLILLRLVCETRRVSLFFGLPLIVFSGEGERDLDPVRELDLEFALECEAERLEDRSMTIIERSSKSSIDPLPVSSPLGSVSIWMGGSGLEVSPGECVDGEAEERGGEMGVTGMEPGVVKTSAMGEPTGEMGEGYASRGIMGTGGTGGAGE